MPSQRQMNFAKLCSSPTTRASSRSSRAFGARTRHGGERTDQQSSGKYLLLDYLSINPSPSTLQCSFCQPQHQSQYITPLCFFEETDWRNKWYGACYGCATCDTSSVPWFNFEELLAGRTSLSFERPPCSTVA